MNRRTLLSISSAMMTLSGTVLVATTLGGTVAHAATRSPASLAKRAVKAIARHDPAAVSLAEQTVALAPGEPDYRALLGRAYLQAGRFASARDAYADALRLRPADGRSALNLALATIALGDWQGARAVLAAHEGEISATDRGLALALAGDPAGGTAVLTQAAREPGATGKTRQNLALALALSGQWPLARAVAAVDMSPADVDKRIADWALFAQPTTASDQIAALLGVHAVVDRGQPLALALVKPMDVPAPMTATVPVLAVSTPAAAKPPAALAAAIEASPAVAAMPAAPASLPVAKVTFGPRREVVQPLPTPLIRGGARPIKVALVPAPVRSAPAPTLAPPAPAAAIGRGDWHVQLGAYANAAIARDAWGRISRRYAAVGVHLPQGASSRGGRGTLYRLSVGGFDRAGAERLCRSVQAEGGACFVRRASGDTLAQWARDTTRVASL